MIAPANLGEVSGIWISASGFLESSSVFWYQFFHHSETTSPAWWDFAIRSISSDPSDRKKILLLISNNRFNFYGTFPVFVVREILSPHLQYSISFHCCRRFLDYSSVSSSSFFSFIYRPQRHSPSSINVLQGHSLSEYCFYE